MGTVVVIRRFFRSYHRALDSSGIATQCVYLLRQASAIACRDHRVASLRRRRELEVGAMVPLLRQCSGFGEIHRIFDELEAGGYNRGLLVCLRSIVGVSD